MSTCGTVGGGKSKARGSEQHELQPDQGHSQHRSTVHQDVLPDSVLVSVLELLPRRSVLASTALVNKRWLRVATSKVQ